MALFELPTRVGRKGAMEIAKLSNATTYKQTPITIKGGGGLIGRISEIKEMTEKALGQYKDKYQNIQDKEVLHDYITACIKNGYICIDTETEGLDPLQNRIAGICPYTFGEKSSYIPINHRSYITDEILPNQIPIEFVQDEFKRLFDAKVDVDMFNATFDIRVLRASGIANAYCTWDASLGSRLLNENELKKNLKDLHNKYCLDGKGDAFRFDDLFKGIPFTLIPLNIAYLYAAHDPDITSQYCEYQRPFLTQGNPKCEEHGLHDVAWVFHNIEMPIVDVVCNMEDNGIDFDFEYNEKLKDKYHKELSKREDKFHSIVEKEWGKEIDAYKQTHSDAKLESPININSVNQLGTLLYDIMGCDMPYDKKAKKNKPKTDSESLKALDNDVAKAILGYRELSTIVSTFIDKLPECVNPNDGRIHCKFNQYGADTGRFSSNNPNLQNIPSHNKDIRKMFKASDGYVLMSSDYSQQEPKSLSALCKKNGDSKLYDVFMSGKDLYSEIASKAFNVPYEECLEFNADGTTNKDGKERRTQAKSILLGVLYGRGDASIAEQLGCSEEKAKAIKDSVFRAFPAIKKFEEDSLRMAYEKGFVTTVCGRKRRLPDMQLPYYEFRYDKNHVSDLLDFDNDTSYVPESKIKYYLNKLNNARSFNTKQKIFQEANAEGIWIEDNHTKIAEATRQCVNARVQGRRSTNCPYLLNRITHGCA